MPGSCSLETSGGLYACSTRNDHGKKEVYADSNVDSGPEGAAGSVAGGIAVLEEVGTYNERASRPARLRVESDCNLTGSVRSRKCLARVDDLSDGRERMYLGRVDESLPRLRMVRPFLSAMVPQPNVRAVPSGRNLVSLSL